MTAESKDEILESIKAALSKDVEEYQTTLSEFQLPAIPNIDLSDYSRIDPEHVREYGKLTGELNTIINHYQDDLIKKQDGIFSTDHYISRGYAAVKAKIDTCLNNLEHSRQSFEEKKAHLEDLRKSIEEINCKLAKQEIQVDSAACITQHKLKKDNADSLANLIKDRNKLTAEINQRESEKKNVKIAAERINSALAYIFMSDKRIRLVPSDGVYTIEVNGHTVLPSDVSIGERNALALCYFFSDMFSGSAANTTYQSERLVVLDDPVSSFDQENKMGVLSYLMFEIENLTCTSTTISGKTIRPETRIICMMHELYAFLALATSINSHDKSAPVKIAQHLDALDFRETKLKELDQRVDNINEYRRNFDEIFAYASEATPGPNLHVGNQARRMLEAFSTFVFREGLEHLFFANVIQGEHADAYNNYYRGIFSRYVVNDESHLQGRVRSLTNANSLLPFLNDTERQRAVRDSICLLYLIMPQHVRSLIVDKKDPSAIATRESCIKGWLKNIRENSPRIGGDPT